MSRIPQHTIDYYHQFNVDEALAEKAYFERSKIGSTWDQFEPHNLPEHTISNLNNVILPIVKNIEAVYLVKRKVLYVPEDPLWIVIIKSNFPWYKFWIQNPKKSIGSYVGDRLQSFFEIGTFVITVDFPVYIQMAELISNSLIFKKE